MTYPMGPSPTFSELKKMLRKAGCKLSYFELGGPNGVMKITIVSREVDGEMIDIPLALSSKERIGAFTRSLLVRRLKLDAKLLGLPLGPLPPASD